MAFSPETANPSTLWPKCYSAGRTVCLLRTIATYVSAENDCYFCQHAHGAVAAYRLGGNEELVNTVKLNFESAAISEKMKALLAIAGKVQKGGKQVTASDVDRARRHGATDKEIHDTVLIAAAFCMYNQYVDGLATWAPSDPNIYRENGRRLAEMGYGESTAQLPAIEKQYV
jgi:AhpD family alkylhydroperoxidase